MSVTNGFRAARLRRRLNARQMAALAGISLWVVTCCENGRHDQVTLGKVVALASALGVSIEAGCRVEDYPRNRMMPYHGAPYNIMGAYMRLRGHTLQSLAKELNVSVETVRYELSKEEPLEKYLSILAEREEMPLDEFMLWYGEKVQG